MRTKTIFILVWVFLVNNATALIHGVDSSTLVSEDTYKDALRQGFTKAVMRGFQEACAIGGRVDSDFLPSYRNARAAGYTDIDVYMVPCTGSGNSCKPFSKQIAELGETFTTNSMQIGRIWLDIEKDKICNPWDYGFDKNLKEAQNLISAVRTSGYKFGIYSSPDEWSTIFGSYDVVLDNSVPLWFATYNSDETLALGTPFGGWTTAFGHQYTDQSASGRFNLNVFES